MTQNVKDLKQKSDMISSTDKIQHPCTIKTLNKLSFPGGSVVMNPPANEGDVGSIPKSGRFPLEQEMETHSSILVWENPWTEEPGRLQSVWSQMRRI